MAQVTRRDFLKSSAAGAALLAPGAATLQAFSPKRSATDVVILGRSGVQVTRLAFGTGTFGGRVQRELGQAEFTRLVRHAYDRGIRFFETADSYHGMPTMLAAALEGIPRDNYQLMTKYNLHNPGDPLATIDRYRKEMRTEYFDILLMHCVRSPTWPKDNVRVEDAFSEAKAKKIIRAHGASEHGLPALSAFPGTEWLDIAMIRMNHNGTRMDTPTTYDTNGRGDVNQVVANMRKVHAQGAGVISMKLAGEGQFVTREARQASLRFAMGLGVVDCVTIGFKNTQEIDEAIDNLNLALNARDGNKKRVPGAPGLV
jgi:aryl-alcohol dehydrogenase-like predicted oxidoreductase